ncbi:MAG: DUF4331 family protein [Saprospiraceae bacterium]
MKTFKKIFQFVILIVLVAYMSQMAKASSHREAPLISSDPLADNVDVYAFRSPDNPDMITLIATYVPLQLPQGGPNYYSFGEDIRYEIHVDNDASFHGDEIIYRFTFKVINEDPTTFFNIRLGKQNQKTTYTLERSIDKGATFQSIITNGVVPPANVGPRSILSNIGLNVSYNSLFQNAITTASTGEKVFAGPTDDPFFVDLGGIFDLGDAPRQGGRAVDGLTCYNVSALAIQVPISTLRKTSAASTPVNILDPDYVIGVWASSSRPAITTLSKDNLPSYSGDWVQVSRLGMPLTNEAVIAIGDKDYWNRITPYDEINETTLDNYFFNPELALYMDDDLFGGAVPAFSPLRIQTKSLGAFDFSNGADGLYGLKGNPALAGTALDDAVFGTLLLPGPGKPRSVDLWPAFHTGVPNVIPYQLATGKNGNPLAAGKPFVNNFLPNGGDMLRLNMAVPPTPRNDPNFSTLGLIQAAAIGLTVAPFNTTTDLEFIPNMDGFPNGRRLEDDVTRIELQAVAGVVLAAVGLWYDDYDPNTSPNPVTQQLLNVLTYTTGVEKNDVAFSASFPYLALPHDGTGNCSGEVIDNNDVVNPDYSVFVSSNTKDSIGVFNFDDQNKVDYSAFAIINKDADGIHYDEKNDVLYQLNRSKNTINAYSKVKENLAKKISPILTASSSFTFTNGREIAVQGNRMVIVQDADVSNGNVDKLIVCRISPTFIVLEKEFLLGFPLWGIHIDNNTLYVLEDLSNKVAEYRNFFDLSSGMITPNQVVTVENLVRTHGITYDRQADMMILTDVGAASSPTDGAYIIIKNYHAKVNDNMISLAEQIRIEGPNSKLGNPVDIAFDRTSQNIYIAERANNGGAVLGYSLPTQSGDQAPSYEQVFSGASALYLSNHRKSDEVALPEINVLDPKFSEDILISSRLTGGNEVPAVTTNAIGVATITFNEEYTQATLNMTVSNLSSPFMGVHIHTGKAGTNGGVLYNLTSFYDAGRLTTTLDITPADVAAFLDGSYYLNVHTSQNPAGEIRGQLALESAETFMASLDGSQENPSVNTTGKGLGSIIYTAHTNVMEISILASNLTGPITGIHLHNGSVGNNGPVVENLGTYLVGNTVIAKFAAGSYISELRNGSLYINIHTEAYPSGEIRGQINATNGLFFDSWLTGNQEAPSVSNKTIGLAIGSIQTNLEQMSYAVLIDNASGPITATHLHKGVLGMSGGVQIDLGNDINGNMISNSDLEISREFLADFLAGRIYFNVHTDAFPSGEVRGQIYRVARDGYVYDLCQKAEVTPVIDAKNASGSGMFAFNRNLDEAHMMVVTNELSSEFQGAHIHDGAVGTAGPVTYDFSDRWSMNGSFFYLTDEFDVSLARLIQSGNAYVNVHTTKNAMGEVRGQIAKTVNCPFVNGVNEASQDLFTLDAFPNPTTDFVDIIIGDQTNMKDMKLSIQNVNGQVIRAQKLMNRRTSIDLSSLNSGVYIMQIFSAEVNKSLKVIKK